MKRLVDDLLDVSRITSGRVQLQKSLVDVGEIVTRVAEANDLLFSSRGHKLHLNVPREELLWKPTRIAWNKSYRTCWSTRPSTPTRRAEIWFSAAREGNDVVFRVRDSGIGIGPDLLPNVFDLFAQAQSLAAPSRRRPGHRADDRPRAGRAARRPRVGHERRLWPRGRVCGSLPAAVEAATKEEPEAPAAGETNGNRGGCSSSRISRRCRA